MIAIKIHISIAYMILISACTKWKYADTRTENQKNPTDAHIKGKQTSFVKSYRKNLTTHIRAYVNSVQYAHLMGVKKIENISLLDANLPLLQKSELSMLRYKYVLRCRFMN